VTLRRGRGPCCFLDFVAFGQELKSPGDILNTNNKVCGYFSPYVATNGKIFVIFLCSNDSKISFY
jgi:hypothetical protein